MAAIGHIGKLTFDRLAIQLSVIGPLTILMVTNPFPILFMQSDVYLTLYDNTSYIK